MPNIGLINCVKLFWIRPTIFNYTTNVNINTTSANNTYVNTNIKQHLTNNNVTNVATKLEVLNVKSIFDITLINEFFNDARYLKPIEHIYNTRRRAEGRYMVESFKNNYGKNSLNVVLPSIINKIPIAILNQSCPYKRKRGSR